VVTEPLVVVVGKRVESTVVYPVYVEVVVEVEVEVVV
jgi:hypothetical protein